jgi:hypothetical protein
MNTKTYPIRIEHSFSATNGVVGIIQKQLIVYNIPLNRAPLKLSAMLGAVTNIQVSDSEVTGNLITNSQEFIELYSRHKDKIRFIILGAVIQYGVIDATYIRADINVSEIINEDEGCCAV